MLIGRYIFPLLLKLAIKRMNKKMNFQQTGYNPFEKYAGKEKEVKITETKKEKKKSKIDLGEYVDFEEIK